MGSLCFDDFKHFQEGALVGLLPDFIKAFCAFASYILGERQTMLLIERGSELGYKSVAVGADFASTKQVETDHCH